MQGSLICGDVVAAALILCHQWNRKLLTMKENDRKVVSTDHRAYGELHGTLCMTEKDRGKYPVFLFHGDIKLVLIPCIQIGISHNLIKYPIDRKLIQIPT